LDLDTVLTRLGFAHRAKVNQSDWSFIQPRFSAEFVTLASFPFVKGWFAFVAA